MKIQLVGAHADRADGTIVDAIVGGGGNYATFYWTNSTATYCLMSGQFKIVEESITENPEKRRSQSLKDLFGQDLTELTVSFK